MSDEQIQPQGEEQQQQQLQVSVDSQNVQLVFANDYRIYNAMEGVAVDLSFNMLTPNPQNQNQPQLHIKVTHRLAMSFVTTKRLAMSLSQFIKRIEQQYGEIPINPGQKK